MHEIDFFGPIGTGFDFFSGSEQLSAEWMSGVIAKAKGDPINFLINSDGGEILEAQAMMTLMRRAESPITATVVGIAASAAASFIVNGANRVEMAPGSQLMIHNAWTFSMGDSAELRKTADTLDHIRDTSIVPTAMERFTGTEAELIAMLDAETWIDSQSAVDQGFADALSETHTQPQAALLRPAFAKHAPAGIVAYSDGNKYRTDVTDMRAMIRDAQSKGEVSFLREQIKANQARADADILKKAADYGQQREALTR